MTPPPAGSVLARFVDALAAGGREFTSYAELQAWSVADLDGFWGAVTAFFDVAFHDEPRAVLGRRAMPGAEWFPGATLNYAEHALCGSGSGGHEVADETPAVLAHSQTREPVELTWAQLRDQVARARAGLVRLGVGRGDRVVAYAPNIPETLVAFLATASLGAVWASCAPEFGARSVVDRFAQIEPDVLLTVPGYVYGDKPVDRTAEVAALRAGLPTLRHVVAVPYGAGSVPDALTWAELLAEPGELAFEPVPFAHPLYVLFSSGTTGKPKAIVHGHGGILLSHLTGHALSWDLRPGDRILWFSTTAWMMWNALVSGLLVGATVVLVDGNPLHPDVGWQWRLAARTRATLMGAAPGFLMATRAAGVEPAREHDLSALRQLGVAGSPLAVEGYRWVAEQLPGVLLNVGSGGTDVCSGIVQGGPWQSVVEGEISGPMLGVAAAAFDEAGRRVVGELGELVITEPMPSMPVGFWGDLPVTEAGSRYRETYFETYDGVWRHGDWVRFAASGSCVVAGRSDATLNRGGVRLGTAEFYDVVEELPEVADSLVVHLEDPAGGNGELLLFVALAGATPLDDALVARIRRELRTALSPRHVPDQVHAVPVVPRNRTGKKLELPAKKILLGAALDAVASRDVLADPTSLDVFVALGEAVTRVAVVGAGVIGAGWAAQFLGRGYDVVATDPAPDAEARLRADVAAHWPTVTAFGPAEGASPRRLTFVADLAEAVADADFVQENGPERLDVKHAVFATLDAAARPGVVLASSSSGLLPTAIAQGCPAHPERVVVGHPFNPPHVVPLVEVVPGERTAAWAVDAAMAFYAGAGKQPIRLRREVPGHVANRLQAALWQEAYSLVERGVASVADIDTAIANGPGLRWAVLGPFANQHLSGGDGGIAHVLEHLGPPTEAWWRDLGEVRLSPPLVERIVAGVADELAGVDPTELIRRRDAVLRTLLAAKAEEGL